MTQLALLGGKPTVTLPLPKWPLISEEEVAAVVKQMLTGNVSILGREEVIEELENDFASYHGREYALSFNAGTASIHAACFAAGVGPGDEVLTTSNTWISAITAIMHAGGKPVFCDIAPDSYTIDPEEIRKRSGPKTKAVIVCHLWGVPVNMDAVLEVAREKNLVVIEDCSHSHGATYKGKKVGTIGDIGCFSLQGSKAMVAGEGGIMVTDKRLYYEKAILLSSHNLRLGRELELEETKRYASAGMCWNYRMHPLAAAIAKVQLRNLEGWSEVRTQNREYLKEKIKDVGLVAYPEIPDHVGIGFYGTPVTYDESLAAGVSRDTFVEALEAEGAAMGKGYKVWYLEPLFQDETPFGNRYPWQISEGNLKLGKGDLPRTEEMEKKIMVIPTFAEPCEELLDQFAEAFHKVAASLEEIKKYQEEKGEASE